MTGHNERGEPHSTRDHSDVHGNEHPAPDGIIHRADSDGNQTVWPCSFSRAIEIETAIANSGGSDMLPLRDAVALRRLLYIERVGLDFSEVRTASTRKAILQFCKDFG